jgi:hypothetical protein
VNRCRNCGDPEHRTQECQEFGPWYPDAGKTAADYKQQAEDISHLVAADILAEHEENHTGENPHSIDEES